MNLVGIGGEGESVWLTWFASFVAGRFAGLCEFTGDTAEAGRLRETSEMLKKSADAAWDGEWYLRGYFDDGTSLGSGKNDECRIDSVAQSFAALAGGGKEKMETALKKSVEILFRRDKRLVMLFDPPFSSGRVSPGYIKGYSPGFRENGGQYTHGAVWLAMGLLLAGMTDLGYDILEALLPQGRPNDVYRTEPYVLAADVYSNEGHLGRGGWTWYSGAAGWYYRVALENLLGLRFLNGKMHISPGLPSSWPGYKVKWKRGGNEYVISVSCGGVVKITRDGAECNDFSDDIIIEKQTIMLN